LGIHEGDGGAAVTVLKVLYEGLGVAVVIVVKLDEEEDVENVAAEGSVDEKDEVVVEIDGGSTWRV
jgi:hypothetical protein